MISFKNRIRRNQQSQQPKTIHLVYLNVIFALTQQKIRWSRRAVIFTAGSAFTNGCNSPEKHLFVQVAVVAYLRINSRQSSQRIMKKTHGLNKIKMKPRMITSKFPTGLAASGQSRSQIVTLVMQVMVSWVIRRAAS